jgi:hypothetical protein
VLDRANCPLGLDLEWHEVLGGAAVEGDGAHAEAGRGRLAVEHRPQDARRAENLDWRDGARGQGALEEDDGDVDELIPGGRGHWQDRHRSMSRPPLPGHPARPVGFVYPERRDA